jgi:putative transposase
MTSKTTHKYSHRRPSVRLCQHLERLRLCGVCDRCLCAAARLLACIANANMSRSNTLSAWRKPGSNLRSVVLAIVEPVLGLDLGNNALAETVNGLYKAEVIHRRGPWRSFEAVEFATLKWVDWFNHPRLMRPIGDIPPGRSRRALLCHAGQASYGRIT